MVPPGRFVYGIARALCYKYGKTIPVLDLDVFSASGKIYQVAEDIIISVEQVITPTMDLRIVDCEKLQISDVLGNVVFFGMLGHVEKVVEVMAYRPGDWVYGLVDNAKSAGVITP